MPYQHHSIQSACYSVERVGPVAHASFGYSLLVMLSFLSGALNPPQQLAHLLLLIAVGIVAIRAGQLNVVVGYKRMRPLLVVVLVMDLLCASAAQVALELAYLARHAASHTL